MTEDKMHINLRNIVLDILVEMDKNGGHNHNLIGDALKKYQYLEKKDRNFIERLARGTIERRIEEDYIIDKFSKTPVKKQKPVIRNILRMAVYQMKYMDSIPVSAACNEAVKLAEKRGFRTLKGFVNGVLRSIASELKNVEYPDSKKDINNYLSIRYSMPVWIVNMWISQYGVEITERMLSGFEKDRKTYIRCNTNKITVENLQQKLESEGIKAEKVQECANALKISKYDYIEGIKAFNDGEFTVQDLSSMLAGSENLIKSDAFVLDVCAAPGGKTINAALIAKNGHVDSRDISDYKVGLIKDNISRLNLENVSIKVWDAIKLDEPLIEKADVVIADLPCSGLGIIGRKPDIKYNISENSLEELSNLQRKILSVVWKYVKMDGVLIYSTCTVNKEENDENAEWFRNNFPFELIDEPHQMLPGIDPSDGFFVAAFRRIG